MNNVNEQVSMCCLFCAAMDINHCRWLLFTVCFVLPWTSIIVAGFSSPFVLCCHGHQSLSLASLHRLFCAAMDINHCRWLLFTVCFVLPWTSITVAGFSSPFVLCCHGHQSLSQASLHRLFCAAMDINHCRWLLFTVCFVLPWTSIIVAGFSSPFVLCCHGHQSLSLASLHRLFCAAMDINHCRWLLFTVCFVLPWTSITVAGFSSPFVLCCHGHQSLSLASLHRLFCAAMDINHCRWLLFTVCFVLPWTSITVAGFSSPFVLCCHGHQSLSLASLHRLFCAAMDINHCRWLLFTVCFVLPWTSITVAGFSSPFDAGGL